MDNMDDKVMANWIKVAEWREAQREEEEERRVMSDGIRRVRERGITNREFFQVDKRDEIRREEQRMKQEQERMKEEQERKKKEEEEQKRITQQDEQSQSLLELEERNAESPYQKKSTKILQNSSGITLTRSHSHYYII